MITRINVVLFKWHADRKSDAALETLFKPLAPYFEIESVPLDWNAKLDADILSDASVPTVFFYALPPLETVRRLSHSVTWIPMWDFARTYRREFWLSLPRNIKIISFSDALSRIALTSGLQVLDVRFFLNPDVQPRANWNGERIAFYWNRIGLVGPRFLERWCMTLEIDRLLFKAYPDPFMVDRLSFELPPRLGTTIVEHIPHTESRDDYLRLVERANVFFAPRPYEGIGMTFIEALARGCAVFAYDGETMNEYIRSKHNGYLFRGRTSFLRRCVAYSRRKLERFGLPSPRPHYYIGDDQPWKEVATLDLQALGEAAYGAHTEGYTRWLASIPRIAAYIADNA